MINDRLVALLEELILFRAALRQNLVAIPYQHRIYLRVKLYELFLELRGTATESGPLDPAYSQPNPRDQENTIYN